MPRPPKTDLKDRIIKAAENKFFRFGFYKVSIDEIVAEAKTSKAAVYRFYSSKEELVEAVLNNLNNHINQNIGSIVNNGSITFQDKLMKIIEFTSGLFQRINRAFLEDLQNHTPALRIEYQKMRMNRINKYYKKLFADGIDEGIVRSDIPLDFVLYFYSKVTEIAVYPSEQDELKYSPKKTYQYLSRLFYEGVKS